MPDVILRNNIFSVNDVTLRDPTARDISGTAAGVAGGSGALTGIGALSGTSAGVSAPTGTASAIGALAGTAAGVSGGSGTLTGIGALSGQSNGIAGGSAAVTAIGDIAGQADGTAGGSATADQPDVIAPTPPVAGGGGGGFAGRSALSQRGSRTTPRTAAKPSKAAATKAKEREAAIIGVLAGRASGHSGGYGRLEGVGALAGVVNGVAGGYGTIEGIEGDDFEAITLILAMAA